MVSNEVQRNVPRKATLEAATNEMSVTGNLVRSAGKLLPKTDAVKFGLYNFGTNLLSLNEIAVRKRSKFISH